MTHKQTTICKVWQSFSSIPIQELQEISGSGSDREYYRIIDKKGNAVIACYGNDLAENQTFLYYAKQLLHAGIRVPRIIYSTPQQAEVYFQEDIGKQSLLEYIQHNRNKKDIIAVYKQTIKALVHMQIQGAKTIQFQKSHTFPQWDKSVVLQDLFYFKNFFLDRLSITYNNAKLISEFLEIADFFEQKSVQKNWFFFMYRDFQGRNILLNEQQELGFIDFQGAMKGPVLYDLISLVFQAKANLPDDIKSILLNSYKKEIKKNLHTYDEEEYHTLFAYCFLMRQLQLLGAYGLRGLIEKKKHFRESIHPLLQHLQKDKNKYLKPTKQLTTLHHILSVMTQDDFIQAFKSTT